MKKLIFLLISMFLCMNMIAQEKFEVYSYASDDYIGVSTNFPVVRNLIGGSVFNVTYEGDWSEDMKGAFEHACKIWEENIPTSLPINIIARIGTIRNPGSYNTLSKVSFAMMKEYGYTNSGMSVPVTMIKSALLSEYQARSNIQFAYVDSIRKVVTQDDDIVITYNKSMLKEFSYSINAEPTDKYDFVTVALRDIARGLGIAFQLATKVNGNQLMFTDALPTPFERKVYEKIGTTDPTEAYSNSTQGALKMNIFGYGDVSLYAPTDWMNGVSLNAFIPDEEYKITQLLSYDFGRGCVIRDIADPKNKKFFYYGLKWEPMATVSTSSGSYSTSGSTEDLIPYKGVLNVGSSSKISAMDTESTMFKLPSQFGLFRETVIDSICWPYHAFYGYESCGLDLDLNEWTFSVLKKDGTWDVLCGGIQRGNISVDLGAVSFHEPAENYARTCDGYLRGRMGYCTVPWDSQLKDFAVSARYYALDYTPQKPEIGYHGVVSPEKQAVSAVNDDDYFQDIQIAIKNIEGTNRIVVEQLVEGDRLPTIYEIDDFDKGYFTATVDKEYYTDFTVVAYNDNGHSRSETLRVEPLVSMVDKFKLAFDVDCINVEWIVSRNENLEVSGEYEIVKLDMVQPVLSGSLLEGDNSIDISHLSNGMYAISYSGYDGNRYSQKFVVTH